MREDRPSKIISKKMLIFKNKEEGGSVLRDDSWEVLQNDIRLGIIFRYGGANDLYVFAQLAADVPNMDAAELRQIASKLDELNCPK